MYERKDKKKRAMNEQSKREREKKKDMQQLEQQSVSTKHYIKKTAPSPPVTIIHNKDNNTQLSVLWKKGHAEYSSKQTQNRYEEGITLRLLVFTKPEFSWASLANQSHYVWREMLRGVFFFLCVCVCVCVCVCC